MRKPLLTLPIVALTALSLVACTPSTKSVAEDYAQAVSKGSSTLAFTCPAVAATALSTPPAGLKGMDYKVSKASHSKGSDRSRYSVSFSDKKGKTVRMQITVYEISKHTNTVAGAEPDLALASFSEGSKSKSRSRSGSSSHSSSGHSSSKGKSWFKKGKSKKKSHSSSNKNLRPCVETATVS